VLLAIALEKLTIRPFRREYDSAHVTKDPREPAPIVTQVPERGRKRRTVRRIAKTRPTVDTAERRYRTVPQQWVFP
jgi:hypothetical protein